MITSTIKTIRVKQGTKNVRVFQSEYLTNSDPISDE